MRTYLKCRNHHIFHHTEGRTNSGDSIVYLTCPVCETAVIGPVEEEVLDRIKTYADHNSVNFRQLMQQVQFSPLGGYYHFTFANMFIGVEKDGFLHT